MNPHIHEPSDTEAVALNSFLDERIYEFNVSATGFRDGKPFAGIIKDESANVIAVINGPHMGQVLPRSSSLGSRRGIGRALLQEAEAESVRRGCHRPCSSPTASKHLSSMSTWALSGKLRFPTTRTVMPRYLDPEVKQFAGQRGA